VELGKVKMGGCCCSGDDDVAEGLCSFGAVAVACGDLSHVAAVFGVAVAVVTTFSSDVDVAPVGSSHVAAVTAFIHLSTVFDMIVAVSTKDSSDVAAVFYKYFNIDFVVNIFLLLLILILLILIIIMLILLLLLWALIILLMT